MSSIETMVPLEKLSEEPYAVVLCYPRVDAQELRRRIKELKGLNVKALEFTGQKLAFNLPVLGKGCVGIVTIAHTDLGRVAIKIRRVDADRAGMSHEAEMLKKANSVNVGPKLVNATENFLLMEFIEGNLLPQWIQNLRGKGQKYRLRKVLRNVLEQCWLLDQAGLDHGELSRAPRHVIVDENDKPHLIDFETASTKRRPSNVTSISQYLFIGSQLAELVQRKLGKLNRKKLIETLKNYKQKPKRENFEKILQICRLSNPWKRN